ncbi:hypothetical protein QZH41_011039 [Actinostola sp. cb2023]|nr:hypothetical protein QZH41_011039 [Actinostola sp. cb2023]
MSKSRGKSPKTPLAPRFNSPLANESASTSKKSSLHRERTKQTPHDIKMKSFCISEDPDETGRAWSNWKKEILTRFRYFRIDEVEDRVDAINIYGGELIRELIETLQDVSPPPGEEQNAFENILAKLDNYFTPMINPDCARSKLAEMYQSESESIAQYYVRLRIQVAKCSYSDPDDMVRSKLLQTMLDKRLRREAMVKRFTLQELLKHAANKEDIDRQARAIEKTLHYSKNSRETQVQEVNKVYEKKAYSNRSTTQNRFASKPFNVSSDQRQSVDSNNCQYCGYNHKSPRSACPASGKTCNACSKIGHFARVCKNPTDKENSSQTTTYKGHSCKSQDEEEYADKKRHTQPHDIQVGDSVLVRQEKRNKFTTPFEPVLYTVISVNRSMITAHRTTDEREITRNSSHYKKVNIQGQRPETPETRPKTQDMRPETQEQNIIGFDVSNSSSEIQIPDNQPSVEHQAVQEPQIPDNQPSVEHQAVQEPQIPDNQPSVEHQAAQEPGTRETRRGREVRQPTWMRDYHV